MGSVAFLAAGAAPAIAQQGAPAGIAVDTAITGLDHRNALDEPQEGGFDTRLMIAHSNPAAPEAHTGARNVTIEHLLPPSTPEPQIVIANPGTSTTSRDPNTGVTGIGQMIIDNGGGGVGLCTGTLINPRTVLFAAHCANSRPATAYGANSGGRGIAVGFEANLRNEAVGRPDELLLWLRAGPDQYKTNVASAFYNVNQVRYNPVSQEPQSGGFRYADIALASFDTPAGNVPTWALLFSPLPVPGTITAARGTGYDVQLVGYGTHGNATTGGATGSDFRRRVAENIIGGLVDQRTFETFLFGNRTGPQQNLYWTDFDDPRRGLTGASTFDFNAFRDNARVTNGVNTEGITAPGDSGGPMILQNFFSKQVVVALLSGGYPRLSGGPVDYTYGVVNFYQPLYLYWDWIAANNSYHYASAVAGDGLWSDPTRWVTTLDPNYFIIANGQLVNGVPNDLGQGKTGLTGQFGEICFQRNNRSQCLNVATGQFRDEQKPIGTAADAGVAQNNAGTGEISPGAGVTGWAEAPVDEPQAEGGATVQALPTATLANGLPGATNFVPNNVDPVRATGAIGAYYDVTLTAAGTTTLNTSVVIDRFRIGTQAARLNITSAGSLTSLIDVTQFAGIMQVDGTLTSVGDFLLLGGALMGSGRINAPFLTNVTGTITPGTATTVGTLTLAGNLVLSSGSQLFINTGGNGVSDLVSVIRTAPNATDGRATLGGTVTIAPRTGTSFVRFGDVYTILTAQGGITGTFAGAPVSAILRPEFIYSANAVQVSIAANPYAGVVNAGSRNQLAFASLLDSSRRVGSLGGVYDVLDLESADSIQATLEAWAPRGETLRTAVSIAALDNNARLIRDRVNGLETGNLGGRLAYYGRRIQTAALTIAGLDSAGATMSDVSVQPDIREGRLPETMSGFVSAGYLDGDSAPMAGTLSSSRDRFDGWYVAAGLEKEAFGTGAIGFALSYTNLDGNTGTLAQNVGGQLYQATVYGKHSPNAIYVDGQLSLGILDTDTQRNGGLPGQPITLRGAASSFTAAGEVGVGAMFGDAIRVGPRAALRGSFFNFGRFRETGGATALEIDRTEYESLQARAGVMVDGRGRIRPNVSAAYVHEFLERSSVFGASFVGGSGNVLFDLASQDKDWIEVTGGLSIDAGNAEISVAADTTIGRDDVSNQSYRASVKIRF